MAKLTLNSTTKPLRRRPDRTQLLLLLMAGNIHPDPGPTAKYACPVCARDVTSRGVSYQCTRCTGWVHAKYSGLLNAAQYRRNKIGPATPARPQRPSNQHHHHPHHLQPLLHLPIKLVMTARSTVQREWNRQQTDRTRCNIGEKQGQSGGYTGVKIQEPLHPELHHST